MQHVVMVHLRLSDNGFGTEEEREFIYRLEEQLTDAIDRAAAGEFDGDLFGEGDASSICTGRMPIGCSP